MTDNNYEHPYGYSFRKIEGKTGIEIVYCEKIDDEGNDVICFFHDYLATEITDKHKKILQEGVEKATKEFKEKNRK